VRELEEKGIGRPSTYAAILSTIQHRDYTKKIKRNFHPTDLGMLVNDLLVKHFSEILDVTFTAAMEDHLDRIEEGREKWRTTLKDFYVRFAADMSEAREQMENVKAKIVETDIDCDSCDRKMVIRWGKNGRFLACSGYPECKSTKNFREEDGSIVPIEKPPDEETSKLCDKCGSPLVIKTGRFGKFLACSAYPKCTNTMPLEEGLPCAVEGCSGTLKARLSKRKRRFFSCSRYPDCTFAVWDRPVEKPCPQCGSPILTEKRSREGTFLICPRPDCGWREQQEEEE
jgi:DNA topoisomerase-1